MGCKFKESVPKKLHIAEEDTLTGRLAKRMAARDFIDKQNLGMGTKASKAATASALKAPTAKLETGKSKNDMPTKMNISGPVKVELEHTKSIKKHAPGKDVKKVAEDIAKDHLKEDPNYYKKIKKLGL